MSHHKRNRIHSDSILENQDSNSNNSTGIINIITSKKQGINTFANDGSFLELFKKKMEEEAKGETSGTSDGEGSKSADERLKKPESSVSLSVEKTKQNCAFVIFDCISIVIKYCASNCKIRNLIDLS